MSVPGVLSALASGPKTTSELLHVTGTCSGDVARTCAGLIKDGRVKRVDGSTGRGSRAIYALTDYSGVPPTPPKRGRLYVEKAGPAHPGHIVDRDPCPKCGVRGDLGCRHSIPPAHIAVHGRDAAHEAVLRSGSRGRIQTPNVPPSAAPQSLNDAIGQHTECGRTASAGLSFHAEPTSAEAQRNHA